MNTVATGRSSHVAGLTSTSHSTAAISVTGINTVQAPAL
jgi:hypothetical protein